MGTDVLSLWAKLGMDSSGFNSGLNLAKSDLSSFGSAMKTGFATVAKVGAAAFTATAGAATAFGVAITKDTASVAAYGDNIDKMSQKMGLSAEAYQEWDAVMQHSGTSIESLQASMKTLANAAETGNKAFETLGFSLEEVKSLSQEELFSQTITKLQEVEDTTTRTYLAGKLLGRGATELGALLNTSAEDTQKMKDTVHELGGVMSDEAVKAAAEYTDSLQDFKTAIGSVKRNLSANFLPSFSKTMQGFTQAISGNIEEGSKLMEDGINGIFETLDKNLTSFEKIAPKMLKIGGTFLSKFSTGIIRKLPEITKAGVEVGLTLGSSLVEQAPEIIQSTVTAMSVLGTELYDNVVTPSWDFIIGELPDLINDGVAGLDFTQAGEFISDNIIKGFNGIADFVDNIDWDVVGTKLAETMNSIDWSGILKAAFDAAVTILANTPELIANFAKSLDGESMAVLVAGVFVPKFIAQLSKDLVAQGGMKTVWSKIIGTSAGAEAAAAGASTAAGAGSAAGLAFATKFMAVAGAAFAGWTIGTIIREQIGEENVDEFLEPAFENIEEGWKTYGDIWDALEKNGEDAYDKLSSDMEALSGKWSMWQDSFNETMDAYKDGFKNVKDTMKPVDDAIYTTGTLFNNLFQRAGEGIFDLKENWKVGATSIKNTFSNKISSMKDDWETGCLDIWSKWDKFVDDWKNKNTDFQVGLTTIKGWFSDLGTKISSLASDASTWGSDLVSAFSDGIEDTFWRVEGALEGFGEKVYDFIHFSEPDKGPLSNFHTFAPDMIDLFAQGIADNAYKAEDAVGTMLDNIKSSFTEDVTPRTIAYGEISSSADTTTEQAIINLNIDGQSMATVLAPLLDVISGKNIMLATRGRQL